MRRDRRRFVWASIGVVAALVMPLQMALGAQGRRDPLPPPAAVDPLPPANIQQPTGLEPPGVGGKISPDASQPSGSEPPRAPRPPNLH